MIEFTTGLATGIVLTMFAVHIGMNRLSRDKLQEFSEWGVKNLIPKKNEEVTQLRDREGEEMFGGNLNLEKKIEIENQNRGAIISQNNPEEVEERFLRDEWGVEAESDEEIQAEI